MALVDAFYWEHHDLFYSEPEPVWIVDSEDFELISNVVPQYYPPYVKEEPEPEPPKPAPPPPPKPPAPVILKVPMCCEICQERVYFTLGKVADVESVECDYLKEQVVVKGKVPAADLLAVCRKVFRHSEILSS